jgi:hypothetical protein
MNILTLGLMGHGKSSFLNTLASLLKGSYVLASYTANKDESVTSEFN